MNTYDFTDHENMIPSERRKSPNATYYNSVIGKIQNKETYEVGLVIV